MFPQLHHTHLAGWVVFISPIEKVAIGDEIPLFCY